MCKPSHKSNDEGTRSGIYGIAAVQSVAQLPDVPSLIPSSPRRATTGTRCRAFEVRGHSRERHRAPCRRASRCNSPSKRRTLDTTSNRCAVSELLTRTPMVLSASSCSTHTAPTRSENCQSIDGNGRARRRWRQIRQSLARSARFAQKSTCSAWPTRCPR